MAERSRVTNVSSSVVALPATYGGKLIPPGGSEVLDATNEDVIAAFGGAHAIAGVVRVEFALDTVPATVDAVTFGVSQTYVDDGDAATLAAAQGHASTVATDAAAAAEQNANAYTDTVVGALPTGIVRYRAERWFRNNFAQGLTDDNLATQPPGSTGYVWRAPRAGSIVGVTANLAGAVTAGFLVVKAHTPDSAFFLQCNPGVRPQGGSLITAAGNYPYPADAQIYVTLSTSADYDDASGRLLVEVWVYVEEAIAET